MKIQFNRNLFLMGSLIVLILLVSSCSQSDVPKAEPAAVDPEEPVAMKAAAFTETPVPAPTQSPPPVFSQPRRWTHRLRAAARNVQ